MLASKVCDVGKYIALQVRYAVGTLRCKYVALHGAREIALLNNASTLLALRQQGFLVLLGTLLNPLP